MTTGLFLGAGASYEIGLPLVAELTAEFRAYFTPEKLRSLNDGWRLQGGGHSDVVVEDVARILATAGMHYEAILGYLEVQYTRARQYAQEYHGLYARLVEVVYHMLMIRHSRNVERISRYLRFLEGIAGLAQDNAPLWVFSLNHDLIVECIALAYGIPLSCGFPERETLPCRDQLGNKIGTLDIEVIRGEQFDASGLDFFPSRSSGINLLKIHGGLGMFTFRNGRDQARILAINETPAGMISAVAAADEQLLYPVPIGARKVKTVNEIAYADDAGEMQFLRRTILAGAFKFDTRHNQVLPDRYLQIFAEHINQLTRLICIGYGFGDLHINAVMRSWLELVPDRRLVIVSPVADPVPNFILHLSPQLEVVRESATGYLQRYALAPLSESEREFKNLCDRHRTALSE